MKRVLIVLPVLNEALVLEQSVDTLREFCRQHLSDFDWRLLIADNGSSDRTVHIAQSLASAHLGVDFVTSPLRGRGRALANAWPRALGSADVLAYMDVDLSSDLKALPNLLRAIGDGGDVAFGSRYESMSRVQRSFLREVTSRAYLGLARRSLAIRAGDLQCGFKAVSADAWRRLAGRVTHPGWFFDTELLLWAERDGLRTVAVPVLWVEARNVRRRSTVGVVRTTLGYLLDVARLRLRLWGLIGSAYRA